MNEKLLNEFAIYYKRIIRVERILKRTDNLPQYKSIIRSKFKVEKNV